MQNSTVENATAEVAEAVAFSDRMVELAQRETSHPGIALIALSQSLARILVSLSVPPRDLKKDKAYALEMLDAAIDDCAEMAALSRGECVRELQPCERGR
jgi:hypothetical protein